MLKHAVIALLGLTTTTGAWAAGQAAEDAAGPAPAQVMVLGTFHFAGGQDMVNPQVDDFLSPRRQAEIAEVLDRLEGFAPTRILVELTPEHEADFNARYAVWRAGERTLSVNERQQIGMALAGRLGHQRLYAVDYQNGMDFEAMTNAAQAAGQDAMLAEFGRLLELMQTAMAELSVPERSLLDRLIAHNGPEMRGWHNFYLVLAQMGPADNPAGAEQMTAWWGRNLHIFANIARQAEPGERLLVIYGSGHKYLLDQFVDGAPNMVWVDPLAYLED